MVIPVARWLGRARLPLVVCSAAAVVGFGAFGVPGELAPVAPVSAQVQVDTRAFLKRYCINCHSPQGKQRGMAPVTLDELDPANVSRDARTWEQVVRKMRAGVMPPNGMPRADKACARTIPLDHRGRARSRRARPARTRGAPKPFTGSIERSTRTPSAICWTWRSTSRALLPPDDASYGFDNIAGVLKFSPTLMERYLTAAQKISRTAVGLPPSSPNIDYFRVADDRAQDDRLPAQLFGTRGGASIDYTFPMDAHYTIRVELSRDLNEQVPIYAEPQLLEVSIDGERVNVFTLPGVAAPPPPPPSEPVAATDAPSDDPAEPSIRSPQQRAARRVAPQRGAGAGAARWRSWRGETGRDRRSETAPTESGRFAFP